MEPIGVIFPISESHYRNIQKGKTVFVKFSIFNRIKSSQIIRFYVSSTFKKVKIEAKIKLVENLNVNQVKEKYLHELIMSEEDFSRYVNKTKDGDARASRNLLVIKFENIKEVDKTPKQKMYLTGNYIFD